MSHLKILILKGADQKKFKLSAGTTLLTFDELRTWIGRGVFLKHLFCYKEAHLLTEKMEVIPKPFFVGLLLLLLSPGACYFKDEQGHEQAITIQVLARLLWQFIRDFSQKYGLIRRICIEVRHLSKEFVAQTSKKIWGGLSGTPVYLRTDLVFGLRCGGSIGHIAGVLNLLDQFAAKPVFLTTDVIPTVRGDLEIHCISPGRTFWDFRELPSIHFNEIFEQTARDRLKDKKIAFIYQRYSINNYSGLKLAKSYGVPFVLEYNGSEIWVQRHWGKPLKYEKLSERIELLNLQGADLIVVVSQPIKTQLVRQGIDADKILVNPNGVDPKVYSPDVDGSHIRKRHHLNGKTVVGFIGTFGKWHGAEVLAEAFGRLLRQFPKYRDRVRLLMIGDGLTMPEVKDRLERLDAMEVTTLTGLIPQEEGPAHLAACDILVASHVPNPDGTPFFGSPTKLFEYMAMGKGIVASDLEQIGEILEHDRSAWMVNPGDTKSLMVGLKVMIDDEQRRERLGKAARSEVVARYTWQCHTARIMNRLFTLSYIPATDSDHLEKGCPLPE